MSHEKVRICDLRPNPFRRTECYPIQPQKIEAILNSFKNAGGFWDNIVGRRRGKVVEIAYGHHRLEALKRFYKDHTETVGIIIKEITDLTMLQIMAQENMQEWKTSIKVMQETVRATVFAFAEGKIELPTPSKSGAVRYAPSFIVSSRKKSKQSAKAYNGGTLAKALGLTIKNGNRSRPYWVLAEALEILALQEKGVITEEHIADLTPKQAYEIAHSVNKVQRAHEEAVANWETCAQEQKKQGNKAKAKTAKRAAQKIHKQTKHTVKSLVKDLSDGFREGNYTMADAKHRAKQAALPKDQPPVDLDAGAAQLVKQIDRMLQGDKVLVAKLEEVAKYKDFLNNPKAVAQITEALSRLASRANKYRQKFSGEQVNHKLISEGV